MAPWLSPWFQTGVYQEAERRVNGESPDVSARHHVPADALDRHIAILSKTGRT